MPIKTILQLILVASLLTVYGLLFAAILHPRVSIEYRDYYIDRTSSELNPVRYTATPEQGINFSSPGLPSFIRHISGFSDREPWGRWTDGDRGATARILLATPLRGSVCLDLNASPAAAIKGKPITVAFGSESQNLVLRSPRFADYLVEFHQSKPADTIEFQFPTAVPKENAMERRISDPRRLGLAITYLRLYSSPCSEVQHKLDREKAATQ
jgi:hypothetical protein